MTNIFSLKFDSILEKDILKSAQLRFEFIRLKKVLPTPSLLAPISLSPCLGLSVFLPLSYIFIFLMPFPISIHVQQMWPAGLDPILIPVLRYTFGKHIVCFQKLAFTKRYACLRN